MSTARPQHEEKSESLQTVWCIPLRGLVLRKNPVLLLHPKHNCKIKSKKKDQPSTEGIKILKSSCHITSKELENEFCRNMKINAL